MQITAAPPTFNARLLGQTEKAANALLREILAGPGLSEPQWVTLTLAVTGEGAATREELVDRVTGAARFARADVEACVDALAAAGLLDVDAGPSVTERGQATFDSVRAATARLTERLWGDLDEADLAVAARVLGTVLARANAELAS
ncbi:MAG: MarR family transcriptional regulator [Solirubrobacteraceae bacterium]